MVAQGADIAIRNKSGESPLDLAELGKHNNTVELLKKAMLEGPHGMLIACYPIQTALSRPIYSHSHVPYNTMHSKSWHVHFCKHI